MAVNVPSGAVVSVVYSSKVPDFEAEGPMGEAPHHQQMYVSPVAVIQVMGVISKFVGIHGPRFCKTIVYSSSLVFGDSFSETGGIFSPPCSCLERYASCSNLVLLPPSAGRPVTRNSQLVTRSL